MVGALGVVCSLVMIVMPVIDVGLVATSAGELTPAFQLVFLLGPAIYGLVVIVFSAIGMWRHRGLPDQQLYIMLTIFPLLMIVGGVIETTVVEAPLYAYFATAGLGYMFIAFTMQRIMTDPLTGLMQRGWMRRKLETHRLTGGGARGGYVFMIDLNGLKATNDAHGHVEGDKSISTVGRAINDTIRSSDIPGYACRYGGDEFLIIACVYNDEGADDLVRRIRERIRRYAVELDLRTEPQIAVGYHKLGDGGLDEETLRQTDKIMYADKRRSEAEDRGMDLFRDDLTELPNANYLVNAGNHMIESLRSRGLEPVVAYCDVRSMSIYNARFGFFAGNDLLRSVASELVDEFPSDLVVRVDGDCFVLVTGGTDVIGRLEMLGKRVFEGQGKHTAGISCGIYVVSDDEDVNLCSERAQQAMHFYRDDCDACCHVYDARVSRSVEMREYVLSHLDVALERDWIKVVYQPIIGAVSGSVTSLEALARWDDPKLGVLMPKDFIPAFEEAGLLDQLDLFVLKKACQALADLKSKGEATPCIQVNLSGSSLDRPDLHENVDQILDSFGIEHRELGLILAPSAMHRGIDSVNAHLERFEDGGYLTLANLSGDSVSVSDIMRLQVKFVRVDLRKIDLSDDRVRSVLKGVAGTVKEIGLGSVAVGVGMADEPVWLGDIGFSALQGNYLGRPASMAEAIGGLPE